MPITNNSNGSSFAARFGVMPVQAQNNQAEGNTSQTRKPAKYWANIGYQVQYPIKGSPTGETETRFLSLAQGVALDNLEDLPTNQRDEVFAGFRAGQNALRDQLIALAQSLPPGGETIVNLQVQVRRVNEESPMSSKDIARNPFVGQFQLTAA